jgi:glycyl-tRNA synthetase
MVKDIQTGDCFRVDHLIEGYFKQLLETKDITDERRVEIEKILSQVNFDYKEIERQPMICHLDR